MNRTQEMFHDLVVQENERRNIAASLLIRQAHVEPITPSLPTPGRDPTQNAAVDPRLQDTAHFCTDHLQQKEIRLRRFYHLELQFPGNPQPKVIPEGHLQAGERPNSTSQAELLNRDKKSRGKQKPKSFES